MSLGKINAVRDMINNITKICYDYNQCKKLTGMTNETLDDLTIFYQQLKDKQAELES